MNDWTEIQIEIPVENVDEASAIAQMVVPYGIYVEDYSDLMEEAPKIAHIDLIDEDLMAKNRDLAIIHIYISPEENPAEALSFLRERLDSESIAHTLRTDAIKEEDWAFGWKKYYHPLRIGEHIVVCPSWETCSLEPGDVMLRLDPGMAFGTGTHETTRLCLQMLEKFVKPGMDILDIGCGSGILSICGVLLGGNKAVGVDIDQTAVKVANENAEMNHVENKTEYLCGDLTDKVSGKYQVVCANIVADVVIRLIPDVGGFMDDNAVLLVSGIIETRRDEVVEALAEHGYQIIDSREEKGWCAMAVTRA